MILLWQSAAVCRQWLTTRPAQSSQSTHRATDQELKSYSNIGLTIRNSEETEKWLQFDQDVFNNLETIGQCVFITCLDEVEIGFASFNPRPRTDFGIICHNCVLPSFQRDGVGKRQVVEILERFRKMRIKQARVVTSDHPFFTC